MKSLVFILSTMVAASLTAPTDLPSSHPLLVSAPAVQPLVILAAPQLIYDINTVPQVVAPPRLDVPVVPAAEPASVVVEEVPAKDAPAEPVAPVAEPDAEPIVEPVTPVEEAPTETPMEPAAPEVPVSAVEAAVEAAVEEVPVAPVDPVVPLMAVAPGYAPAAVTYDINRIPQVAAPPHLKYFHTITPPVQFVHAPHSFPFYG